MSMTALAIFIALIAICVLGAACGSDSRLDRPGRQL
jgi:hypothetical protein